MKRTRRQFDVSHFKWNTSCTAQLMRHFLNWDLCFYSSFFGTTWKQ